MKIEIQYQQKYVAFLDVLGFSDLVYKGGTDKLNTYFTEVVTALKFIQKKEINVQIFAISDSITLIAPFNKEGLVELFRVIQTIQAVLINHDIWLRGGVSYGNTYYNPKQNIIVGDGFIKAYKLESQAVHPKVIIDPQLIVTVADNKTEFLNLINYKDSKQLFKKLIYSSEDISSTFQDNTLFVDYAFRFFSNILVSKKKENHLLDNVYENIRKSLYGNFQYYPKYIWLKNYFIITITNVLQNIQSSSHNKKALEELVEKLKAL